MAITCKTATLITDIAWIVNVRANQNANFKFAINLYEQDEDGNKTPANLDVYDSFASQIRDEDKNIILDLTVVKTTSNQLTFSGFITPETMVDCYFWDAIGDNSGDLFYLIKGHWRILETQTRI